MFRLANGKFVENKELKKVATECLTETIKIYLENYFHVGYEKEDENTLYTKVDYPTLVDLIPYKLLCEMEESNIDEELFLRKKTAEFMNILNSKEEITPDIFIEYLLYRMIITESNEWFEESEKLKKLKPVLRRLLEENSKCYAEEVYLCDYEEDENGNYIDQDGEFVSKEKYNKILKAYQKQYVEKNMTNLTDLPNMSIDDDSFVFWDWDFSFFDEWGFEPILKKMSKGIIADMAGYGEEYIKDVFKSSGMDTPKFLENN